MEADLALEEQNGRFFDVYGTKSGARKFFEHVLPLPTLVRLAESVCEKF